MLQRLTTWLWYTIVLLVVVLAVYSSFGRLLVTNVSRYQDEILREINNRLDFVLEVDELSGSWRSLSPSLIASGVRVIGDEHAPVGLEFDELSLELDVLDTLLTLSPKLYILEVSGGRAHADIDENGRVSLAGIVSKGQVDIGDRLNDFIFNAERLTLSNLALELHAADATRMSYLDATLRRDGSFRRVNLYLQAPDRKSWFRLAAEGDGDLADLSGFDGLFHLQSEVGDLALFPDLLARAGLEPAGGSLKNELWVRVDRGEVKVTTRASGRNVALKRIESDAGSIELEQVDLLAAAEYLDEVWEFRVRDLRLLGAGRQVSIDRLVGSFGKDRLSLRLADLNLATLSRYLEGAGLLPDTARDVLGKLSPEGELETAEFTLEGLSGEPDWLLTTNFREVDVKPWKGAPGLTNASGYAELAALEGSVQLSSSEFSMDFPTVYREPLDYQSFSAELQWQVLDESFRIRSGPFIAQAKEGEVRGLFALELPRIETPTGSEMDLMVSLRDTHPDYRRKYLPYTLNPGLLEWLEPSIGEGKIREAGFIFRGSLTRDPQRRTVQLFFNLVDTRIDYHPQWPSLTSLDGIALIDDSSVDVHGARGKLLDSDVTDVVVRVRQDDHNQLHLAVNAAMTGSAADGLAVVNDSPLREQIGDSFADWQLDGRLDTRLELDMNLSDNSQPPGVDLVADFAAVDVSMGSLNLEVEGVSGQLTYNSETGFHGDDFRGRMWGKPLQATVRQGRDGDGPGELDVAVTGPVAADALREWLELDMLRLAQGETQAKMHILVPAEGGARLEAASDLQGVSLDLPSPWSKQADERRLLRVEMPLASGPRTLELTLEESAFLAIDFDEQGLAGGNLGFGAPLEQRQPGRFLLGGQLASMSWSEWDAFIEQYLADDEPGAILSVIRRLEIGRLSIFGRDLDRVILSGTESEDSWRFDFITAWAAGSLVVPDDLSRLEVDLERLDVEGFVAVFQAEDGPLSGGAPLPPTAVSIASLHRGQDEWGNLAFNLRQSGENLHFEGIKGTLRKIDLGGEEGMRLDWLRGDQERTRLLGALHFTNFGDVLKEFQYEEIVETNSGRADVEVTWPGNPGGFALVDTTGDMRIDVQEGRFLNTSGAAEGTLRVVAILNLADVVSKLSLDLSSIYKSGVPFDSIEGDLHFEEGIVDVAKLDVKGRASRFQFAGLANVREESIDGELVATLPIASNLPWMFALVSGLPAAAGVYVISKLFDKQMDRFSSAVYTVNGPWGDPKIDFERIFDNSAKERVAESATEGGTADSAAEESADQPES